jgi:hypothetical protein
MILIQLGSLVGVAAEYHSIGTALARYLCAVSVGELERPHAF